jgi:hypothetical protein
LIGYYHNFFNSYGQIATPLTTLLKKETFYWTQATTKYFEKIKEAMCTTHVLATLDFTNFFIVECDASDRAIGIVLMQEGMPLAFESKQIKRKNLVKPIYEKTKLVILHVVKKWHPYLKGRHFKVKTYHDHLKYFLEK